MKKLLLTAALILLLVIGLGSCEMPSTPPHTNDPSFGENSLRMPSLTIDENGLASWSTDEEIEYWIYVINYGLTVDEDGNPLETEVKTQETSVQLTPGDTILVWPCRGERRGTYAEASYYLNAESGLDPYALLSRVEQARDDAETVSAAIAAREERILSINERYLAACTAAADNDALDALYLQYWSADAFTGLPRLDAAEYKALLSLLPEIDELVSHELIHSVLTKLELKDMNVTFDAYKAEMETLQSDYEKRVRLIQVRCQKEGTIGLDGTVTLAMLCEGGVGLTLEKSPVSFNGYQLAHYEEVEGDAVRALDHPFFPVEDQASLRLIYEGCPYEITYNTGATTGMATCKATDTVRMDEKFVLARPYCDELFFDCWVDEEGREIDPENFRFDYAKNITLTAKWFSEPSYNQFDFESKHSYKNADGTEIVTLFGYVECVSFVNGVPTLFINPDSSAKSVQAVVAPRIREVGSTSWKTFSSTEDLTRYFSIFSDGSLYSTSNGVTYLDGALVCVQGLLTTVDGVTTVENARVLKTDGNSASAGAIIPVFQDFTSDLRTAGSHAAFGVKHENATARLNRCVISENKVDGCYEVRVDGSTQVYRLSFNPSILSASELAELESSLVFGEPVTLTVMLRLQTDKSGTAELILEPCLAGELIG